MSKAKNDTPKEIIELEDEIERKMNKMRISAIKANRSDMKSLKEIIKMKAKLDDLYSKWTHGELS